MKFRTDGKCSECCTCGPVAVFFVHFRKATTEFQVCAACLTDAQVYVSKLKPLGHVVCECDSLSCGYRDIVAPESQCKACSHGRMEPMT